MGHPGYRAPGRATSIQKLARWQMRRTPIQMEVDHRGIQRITGIHGTSKTMRRAAGRPREAAGAATCVEVIFR